MAESQVGPGSSPNVVGLELSAYRFSLPSRAAGPIFAVLELLLLSLAPYLGSMIYHAVAVPAYDPPDQLMITVGVSMSGLYLLLSHSRGSFDLEELRTISVRKPVVRWCLVFMFFALASFSLKIGDMFSRGAIMSGFLIGIATIVGLRLAAPFTVSMAFRHHLLEGRRTILLSDGSPLPMALPLDDSVQSGFSLQGWFILPATSTPETLAHLDRLCSDVVDLARERKVEEIVLVADAFRQPTIADVIDRLRVLPLRIRVLPRSQLTGANPSPIARQQAGKGLEVQSPPFSRAERLAKRLLDLTAASVLLVALSPILVAIAIAIRLDSRGPVLFRQTRVGYGGCKFMIYKFRSMRTSDNGAVIKQAERGDVRITRVGRFLREKSLDELPQLINVVLGDMSLVGPRPHAVAHDRHYAPRVQGYAWRYHALPGITGWAQVMGHRGETKTTAKMEARVAHDLWYIRNWSLWLDIKILLMTFGAVLRPTNAY